MGCRFCENNRTNPEWGLDEEQCSYAMGIGVADPSYRVMFVKDPYRPLLIEFGHWKSDLKPPQWLAVAGYFPKYCPECGRKIDEYDRSKFDNE